MKGINLPVFKDFNKMASMKREPFLFIGNRFSEKVFGAAPEWILVSFFVVQLRKWG